MSISDPKVAGNRTANRPKGAGAPKFATPPPPSLRDASEGAHTATPRNTISDRGLTLIQISCDFVCACIALPLSLLLLSRFSSASVNSSGELTRSMEIDSLFPIAVVLALALAGVYRLAHRRLQPSAFLELRELSFCVGCGCVLALAIGEFLHSALGTAEPYATQLVIAGVV